MKIAQGSKLLNLVECPKCGAKVYFNGQDYSPYGHGIECPVFTQRNIVPYYLCGMSESEQLDRYQRAERLRLSAAKHGVVFSYGAALLVFDEANL